MEKKQSISELEAAVRWLSYAAALDCSREGTGSDLDAAIQRLEEARKQAAQVKALQS